MKRIKRFLNLSLLLVLFVLLPFTVAKAAGDVTVSNTSVNVRKGQTVTFTVTANNAAGTVNITSSNSAVATVSPSSFFLDSLGGASQTVTVTGVAEGSASLAVSINAATYDYIEVIKTVNIGVNVTVPSTNNYLSALSVSHCNINFNPDVLEYDCRDLTEFGSVSISATKEDGRATVSGTGNKSLTYGNRRTLNVVVTAESGDKRTYVIRYDKQDNRSGDSNLSSLTVEGQNLNFDPNTYDYNLIVPNRIESVTVNATASDPTSSVSGIGTFDLPIIGDAGNLITITVTAENGKTSTYTINVIRSDVENIPSTTLINLTVNGNNIPIKGDEKILLIGVDSNVTNLELGYETTSRTSTYDVVGNNSLSDGINIVSIKVSDNGVNTSTYTLIVNKASGASVIVDDLSKIKDLSRDVTYNTLRYQNPAISDDLVKMINSSSNSLIYNVTNEYKGLLYSVKFNKDSGLSSSIEPYFNRVSGDNVTYATNIPANTAIKLYTYGNFDNNQSVKVYSYDEADGTYTLVTTATVKDYYLDFNTNGATKYVFSLSELKGNKKGSTSIVTIILIVVVVLLLGFVVMLFLKNKKLATSGASLKTVSSLDNDYSMNISPKKENKIEEVNEFKPLESNNDLFKESSIALKEEKEEFKPLEPVIEMNVEPKEKIDEDIAKFPSMEEELKKNMFEEKHVEEEVNEFKPFGSEVKDIDYKEPINPFESNNDYSYEDEDKSAAFQGYTIDLTSIEEEIRRHEFEEEIANRIEKNRSSKKSSRNSSNKELNAYDLTSVDEDIERHNKRRSRDEKISPIELGDYAVDMDNPFSKMNDKVKVVEEEPYFKSSKSSRSSRSKKLGDTAILPVITEEDDF